MIVLTPKRLTFSETRLPESWIFRGIDYKIHVWFGGINAGVDNTLDPSSRVFDAMKRAWTSKPPKSSTRTRRTTPVQWNAKSLERFVSSHQEQLSKLKEITYIGILPLCFEGEAVQESLVVITTDWEASKEIEKVLRSGRWEGKPVYVVRDEWKNLHTEPVYLDKVLVGARGGGGEMTLGVILCDKNKPEERYVAQCAHGYRATGIGIYKESSGEWCSCWSFS